MHIGTDKDGALVPVDINGHIYILGHGKDLLLTHLALQLPRLVLIDRRGDVAQEFAEHTSRPYIYWEPVNDPIGFNPLKDTMSFTHLERLTKALHFGLYPSSKSGNYYEDLGEDLIRHTIKLLSDSGKGLKDVARVLKDKNYRKSLLYKFPTNGLWGYEDWDEKEKKRDTRSFFNRLYRLQDPIVGRAFEPTLSLTTSKAIVLDLSQTSDTQARIIGGLLFASLMEQDFQTTIILNGCHLFLREWETPKNTTLVLANDYETQLSPALLDAILDNCETVASFYLGADVRRIGARLDLPEPNILRRLNDGQFALSTRNGGQALITHPVSVLPLPERAGYVSSDAGL